MASLSSVDDINRYLQNLKGDKETPFGNVNNGIFIVKLKKCKPWLYTLLTRPKNHQHIYSFVKFDEEIKDILNRKDKELSKFLEKLEFLSENTKHLCENLFPSLNRNTNNS